MVTIRPLDRAQYRLAKHYLGKLRTAATAVRFGKASVAYGLNLFDQEWAQIKQWQAWTAQHSMDGEEWAYLCKEFPLVGREVLAVRNHAADHAVWLQTALEAAHQLHDHEAQCDILHELSIIYYRLGVLDNIEHFARELLRLGEATHDMLSIARGCDGLGAFATERGLYAEAEQYYHRALKISMELGTDTELGRALNGLGTAAFYMGDYQNAHQYFLQHLELTEAAGKKSEFCTALLSVGHTSMKFKDYAGAEKYIQSALTICRAHGFQRLLGICLINLGLNAVEQNQLELACNYLEEGIQTMRAVGIRRQIIQGLSLLGYTRWRQGNFYEAIAPLHEGLQMARQSGMPRYNCILQRHLAYTYLAVGDVDAARFALNESLTIARDLNIAPEMTKTLICAITYWLHMGFGEQAGSWAGCLRDSPYLDEKPFEIVCRDLEAELGAEHYQQALERGKTLALDAAVAEVLSILNQSAEGMETETPFSYKFRGEESKHHD